MRPLQLLLFKLHIGSSHAQSKHKDLGLALDNSSSSYPFDNVESGGFHLGKTSLGFMPTWIRLVQKKHTIQGEGRSLCRQDLPQTHSWRRPGMGEFVVTWSEVDSLGPGRSSLTGWRANVEATSTLQGGVGEAHWPGGSSEQLVGVSHSGES